ncbi:MAG: hypothetical protein HYX96_05790 [Chloroflexi bacterium]|nr:hypothetical protein [Chloroflexota bacterium]
MPDNLLGDILHVDLTTGGVERESVTREMAERWLGGFGLNASLAYKYIPPSVGPLSPENPIIFGAGTLAGTLAPGTAKVMAAARFPLSGTIGVAFGGACGDTLRQAGYSQIIVTGKAPRPVCLRIADDEVELCDAAGLTGKDIFETTDALWRRYGKAYSVIAIGAPGEQQSRMAMAFVNKTGSLGKGGLGAVMGSKNLKAVAIKGTKGVKVADGRAFMPAVNELCEAINKLPYRADWLGLGVSISAWGRRAEWPGITPEKAAEPFGYNELMKSWVGILSCPNCPVGCKTWVRIQTGKFAGSMASVHSLLPTIDVWKDFNVGSLYRAIELTDRCNRDGIDEVETGGLIKLVITLFEHGVIGREDTDGLVPKHDYDTVSVMLDKMHRREGLGALLADGTPALVAAIGPKAREHAATIKGIQPLQDPRKHKHFHTWSVDEMVNPRHPVGQPGNTPAFFPGHPSGAFVKYLKRLGASGEAVSRTCGESSVNMARLAKYAEDYYALCSCLGVCIRIPLVQTYGTGMAARLFNAATGLDMAPEALMLGGERAWNLVKAINAREGYTRADDRPPEAFFQPLVVEGQTLTLKDYYGAPLDRAAVDRLLDDYYDERGWDVARGIPTRQKLASLGLDEVAADLEARGVV